MSSQAAKLSASLFGREESKKDQPETQKKTQLGGKCRDRAAERRAGHLIQPDEDPETIPSIDCFVEKAKPEVSWDRLLMSPVLQQQPKSPHVSLPHAYAFRCKNWQPWTRPGALHMLSTTTKGEQDDKKEMLLQAKSAQRLISILNNQKSPDPFEKLKEQMPKAKRILFPELATLDDPFGKTEEPAKKKDPNEAVVVVERGGLFGFSDQLPRLDRLSTAPNGPDLEKIAITVDDSDEDGAEDPMAAFISNKKKTASSSKKIRFNVIGDDEEDADALYATGTATDIAPLSRFYLEDDTNGDDADEQTQVKKKRQKVASEMAKVERMVAKKDSE